MDRQRGIVEIDRPAARFLDPAADLALDLRRRSAETACRRAAPRRGTSRVRAARDRRRICARDRVDVERRPPGLREIGDAEDAATADRAPAAQSAARRPSTISIRPISTRTSATPRSRVASRRFRTSRATNHGAVVPLQRDFLVVDDDGFHAEGEADCSPSEFDCGLYPSSHRSIRFAGAVSADDRALDGARQPGVDPVAGEKKAFDRCRRRTRGLTGASENVARFSRTTVARISGRRARRERLPRPRAAARRVSSSWPSTRARRAARHQRQVRRVAAERQALVEDPLHLSSRQPDERLVHHRAVVPEVDGHDRHRLHRGLPPRSPARVRVAAPDRTASEREPRHREHDLRRVDALAAHVDAATRAAFDDDARERVDSHSPPRASMKSRAGSAYISCSGLIGSTSEAAVRIGPEHLRQHADERRRGGVVRRLVEGRDCQRLPQPVAELPALAVRREPLRDGAGCTADTFRSAATPCAHDAAGPPASNRKAVAPRHRVPIEHAGEQVQRRGKRGQRSTERRPVGRGTALRATAASGRCRAPDPAQERERRAIAAEEHMLPVVDELAGLAIGKAVARPPSCGRASRTGTAAPRSASRAPALRPAKPAPTTTTSGGARSRRVGHPQTHGRPCPGRRGDQGALRPRDSDDPAEHVVVGALDAVRSRDRSRP